MAADDPAMVGAREWARRRLNGIGTAGTFGGRHHRLYEDDVEAMLSAGQFGTAEHLLLGLIDAVEDEADELGLPIDPSYFLTLTDMLVHENRPYEAQGGAGAARGSGRPSRRGGRTRTHAEHHRRRAGPGLDSVM